MDNKVSVIVPVYNVSKYLKQCFDSIKNQSYKNLEIILIDDGSTDGSSIICDELKKEDKRVKVIHQKNKGLAETRNIGIKHSTSNLITFIDSDDYVEKDYIRILVDTMDKYNSDIVQCNFKYFGSIKNKRINNNPITELSKENAIKHLLLNDIVETMAWGKLYKKEIFKDIKYPKGKYYEDLYTTYKLIDKANKIVVLNKELYNYRIVDNSIINKEFNIKHLDVIKCSIEREKYINNKYKKLDKYAKGSICHNACLTLEKIFNSNKEYNKEIKYIKRIIKHNLIPFILFYKCSIKTKLFATIASINTQLCLKLYKIIKK